MAINYLFTYGFLLISDWIFFFRLVIQHIANDPIEINNILPCKGIGILHLAVGIDPIEKSKKCTEILLKHGGDPNLW